MNTQRLGWFAALTLVVLRVGIGMHFFDEGAKKMAGEKPFQSAYFLDSAKGPLAPMYKNMIWDRLGKHRLGYALEKDYPEYKRPTIDLEPTLQAWDEFRGRAMDYYGVTDVETLTEAEQIVSTHENSLRWYIGQHADDIIEYFYGLDRLDRNAVDPTRDKVASLWGQRASIESDMASKRKEWLWTVDGLWDSVESDLNQLGMRAREDNDGNLDSVEPEEDSAKSEDTKVASAGPTLAAANQDPAGSSAASTAAAMEPLELQRPGRRRLDSVHIDKIIPWFDLTIGALLIVGLFTRFAALGAGLFLLSVCLSQWPFAPGATPIWYQLIEMLACFALVGLAAGRFAGLDGILNNIRLWCFPPRDPAYE